MDSQAGHPSPTTTGHNIPVVLALSGALLLTALTVILLGGRYTRFHADDFCLAGEVAQRGLLAAQGYWYTAWSGRYAATLIASLLTLMGPGFAPILPLPAIGLMLGGLAWTFRQTGQQLGWPRPTLPAVLLALAAVFAVLASIPNRYQSLYWLTGLTTYTLPLALLSLGAGWILHQARQNQRPSPWLLAANGLLAFAVGGFSETYTAAQAALFTLAFAGVLLSRRSKSQGLLPVLAAWLAGSLAALTVIALAPGNAARQALLPETPGLLRIATFSLRNAAHIAGKFVLWTPLAAGSALLVPLALGWSLPGRTPETGQARMTLRALWSWPCVKALAVAPPVGFALLAAACAPTVYAMNAYPDDRAIVVPQFFLALTVLVWGFLLGRALRRAVSLPGRTRSALLLAAALLALVVTGASTAQTVRAVTSQAPEATTYAARWDARDALLRADRAQGVTDLEVVSLESRFALADLSADPNDWVNRCVAKYYDFQSVTGR